MNATDAPTNTPAKLSTSRLFGSRKNKIIVAIITVAALLGAAFAVYAIIVTPTKQPYRDAKAQYENVYNANVAFMARGTALNSAATNAEGDEHTKVAIEILEALKKESELLGEKEVLTTGEGKELYETFNTQLIAYINYNTKMLKARQAVRPVIYDCSMAMSKITEDKTSASAKAKTDEAGAMAMQDCADTLQALTGIPDADYKALVDESQPLYAALAENLRMQAGLATIETVDASYEALLTDKQDAILKKLDETSATFAAGLNVHRQAVDITRAAMTLDEYLKEKSRII